MDTSGVLITNGYISSSNGNVVLDSAAGLDTNQPVSATGTSATVTINGPPPPVDKPLQTTIDHCRWCYYDRQHSDF